jgi:hypothetical protein
MAPIRERYHLSWEETEPYTYIPERRYQEWEQGFMDAVREYWEKIKKRYRSGKLLEEGCSGEFAVACPVSKGTEMRHRLLRSSVTLLCLFCSTESPVYADRSEEASESLRGLRGLRIVVEEFRPEFREEIRQGGLEHSALESNTKWRLRKKGVRVLSENEWAITKGRPYLYVKADLIRVPGTPRYTYLVKVELNQQATLVRNPSQSTFSSTWSIDLSGFVLQQELKRIYDDVGILVDIFVNDYLTVNPHQDPFQ